MANALSLLVKIGANDKEITDALAGLGKQAKATAADIEKIGDKSVGDSARKSLAAMNEAMKGITDSQQRLADRASLAARGLESIGGVAKLTDRELTQVNKTLQDGINAYRALGQQAPAELEKIASSVKSRLGGIPQQMSLTQRAASSLTSSLAQLASGFALGNLIANGVASLGRFATEAFQSAGKIADLSSKTGLSTDTIQRFQHVASLTGSTLEQFSDAAFKLGARVSGGSGSVRSAVDQLGLSFGALRSLSPDQQFVAVADALGRMEDPQRRNQLALELFGKSASTILPAIAEGYSKLAGEANVASDAQIKALDKASDRWSSFVENTKRSITAALGNIVMFYERSAKTVNDLTAENQARLKEFQAAGAGSFTDFLKLLEREQGDVKLSTDRVSKSMESYATQLSEAQAKVAGLTGAERAELAIAIRLGASQEELADRFGLGARELVVYNEQIKAAQGVTTKQAEAAKKAAEAQKKWNDSISQMPLLRKITALPIGSESVFGDQIREQAALLESRELRQIEARLQNIGREAGVFTAQIHEARTAARGLGDSFRSLFSGDFSQVFKDIGGFLKGGLGEIGTGFLEGIGKSLLNGVSGLIGAGLGALGKAVGGLFRNEEVERANDLRDSIQATFGSLHKMNVAFKEVGLSAQALLDADSVKEVEAIYAEFQQRVEEVGAAFGELQQASSDTFGVLPAQMRPAVEQLLEMGALTAQQRDLLHSLLSGSAVDFDGLTKLAEGYGISLEQLGSKFQQANLDKLAAKYTNDFKALSEAGADVNGLLVGMQDEIQNLLNDAFKFGGSIPEAMKPLLEQMVAAGLLVDANGTKLKDLAGVTFNNTPIEDSFSKLEKAINNLIKTLGGVPEALSDIAQTTIPPINIPVEWQIPPLPTPGVSVSGAATGGLVTANGIQHFAGGGRVLPFLRRGRDTVPAMLTPGEIVLNADQQEAVGRALRGGRGGMVVNVSVNAQGDFTSIGSEQRLARRVGRAVVDDVSRSFRRGAL